MSVVIVVDVVLERTWVAMFKKYACHMATLCQGWQCRR